MLKRHILVFFFLCASVLIRAQPVVSSYGTFVAGNGAFLLNGKPFVVRAAEIHYPRIPRQYWEHRIKMCKALGMNTICIYLFWNYHEQQEGRYDFSGDKDVAAFVRLVQKNGMYCIVRPGPYACAEWDMGGLPWWLLKKPDLEVRTGKDSYFVDRATKYLTEVGKQLAPLQIQNGGNILMVQVENEYASFGSEQKYMETIRDAVRAAGFDKVQLFRCDWSSNFNKYKLDGVTTTLNFGAGSNIDAQFKPFKAVYPDAPLMCSEYWTGWFDHWGRPHETRAISTFIGSLKDMLDRKISFSLYMAHGGTTFGQWGGGNAPPYSAMATSYDYNAPIGEQGNATDKFFAVRDLLKNYLQEGEALPEIPAPMPLISIPRFRLSQRAGLFENLPPPQLSNGIKSMEEFNQGWGRMVYRTTIPASAVKRQLTITEVHDWANVFVNGKQAGRLDRRRGDHTIDIPPQEKDAQLDILVEATGRVNYGKAIIDRKGITERVEIGTPGQMKTLLNWKVFNLPVDQAFQASRKFRAAGTGQTSPGPAWYRGTFKLSQTGDTFLDVSTWGKGMVWVNGYNLGRFWKIGPQQTLFLPGCWLKNGVNEIIVLDVDQPADPSVQGLKEPVLDEIHPDESLLHRRKGESLDLTSEKPVAAGSLLPGGGWKEVTFKERLNGRYFCLEAVSAQQAGDPLTTIAELELIGTDGQTVSTLGWKIVYADSEEITSSNGSAEKIFDQQESTVWQTQSTGAKPGYPHQVVIDLGGLYDVKGFRLLPRSDKSSAGMVKDWRVFFRQSAFRF